MIQPLENVRVFVVDDHSLFRAGVRSEIEAAVDLVGEAGDVAGAVELIRRVHPDVVLLDVHLPDGGGRAVLEAVLTTHPDIRFLALSVSEAADDVIEVIRAGARGYVTKAITGAELCEAIRRVHEGDGYFSPRLAGFVLDAFRGARAQPLGGEPPPRLTARVGSLRDESGWPPGSFRVRPGWPADARRRQSHHDLNACRGGWHSTCGSR